MSVTPKKIMNYAVLDKQKERDELARQMAEFEKKNGKVVCEELEIREGCMTVSMRADQSLWVNKKR